MTLDPLKIEEIFHAALQRPDAERGAYLESACAGNGELRDRVAALLKAVRAASQFLERPAIDQFGLKTETNEGSKAGAGDLQKTQEFATTNPESYASDVEESALTFLQPGTIPDSLGRIGHYEVLQVLGKGAFGIVFRAFDDVLKRVVAVKVLAPQVAATSPARKRFLREARSSAQVRHENVVQVHAVEETPLPYLVMEFIPGETLQQRLDRTGPLEPPEVLRIGRQIAEGLAAAHATDLIHRDIKPGNILLESGNTHVKITDFGLARAADDASISQSGIIAGTPMFMAPEQATGATLDQRADLFSLGSVLYQMVTGRPPFRAATTLAVLKRVAEDTPRAIRELIPETPDWLCDIITKLHAKNPADRYQSARSVADLLAECEKMVAENELPKKVDGVSKKTAGNPGRKSWAWVGGLCAVMGVVGLALFEAFGVTRLTPRSTSEQALTPSASVDKHSSEANPSATVGKKTEKTPPETIPDPKPAAPTTDPQDAPAQLERVRQELIKHNARFDGTLTPTIEAGVVTGLALDATYVADLTPIRQLEKLKFLSCESNMGMVRDLAPLQGLKLQTLLCTGNPIQDLSPLRGMPLERLACRATHVSDLSPLKGMNLTDLECGLTNVNDLTPLKGMPLKRLVLDSLKISDLSALEGMPLKSLHVGACSNLKDLSVVKGMPLDFLNCSQTAVTDFSPLRNLPLTEIALNFKADRDTDHLRSIKSLRIINYARADRFWQENSQATSATAVGKFTNDMIGEISSLPGPKQIERIRAELKRLNPGFDGSLVSVIDDVSFVTELELSCSEIVDIRPIQGLTKLRQFSCTGRIERCKLADITPIRGLPLRVLHLSNTSVNDLTPLRGASLESLYIDNTFVSDLTPLTGMKLTNLNCSYTNVASLAPLKGIALGNLWCNHTMVSDLTPLAGMPLDWLTIHSTNVTDFSPIKGSKLTRIYMDYREERDREHLLSIKTLQFINEKPPSEFLKKAGG